LSAGISDRPLARDHGLGCFDLETKLPAARPNLVRRRHARKNWVGFYWEPSGRPIPESRADPQPDLEPAIRQDLTDLRRSASRFFVALIWLHTPVIAILAASNGLAPWRPALIMAVGAAIATLVVWRRPESAATRMTVAATLTVAPMLMVYAGAGLWQIDWHMYFFVVFGMLVAYVDWRPILVSAGLTAGHHTLLTLLFPSAVFPEADLPRVVLHAAIVAVDCVVLFWLVRQMRQLFARIGHTNAMLEERIAERTAEVSGLNATLAKKLRQLEGAFANLETEVAQRKEIAGRLDHLAQHDLVTGLPNRVLLMDRLGVALANAERSGAEVVVLYVDLDGFKRVNDTCGHAAGDRALSAIALRLRACLRTGDTASRVGGDEFTVVCSVANGVREIAQIAERIIREISAPIEIDSSIMHVGANIGVSLYPTDGADPDDLIRKADAAMYRAKEGGHNTFHLYTPEIHAKMVTRATLAADLHNAIERNEFVAFYQPVISLTSRKIIGAEALARWKHPTRGILGPDEFIAFAEEHGLIGAIGVSIMRQACEQVQRLALQPHDEFTMAVNVSAIEFRQPDFVESVKRIVRSSGTDVSRLEIEITESVMMDDVAAVTRTLYDLNGSGIRLSVDDFGTGYSSLAYIKTFPVHTLKIDRSFVNDIADNATDQAIAATIITLAHNLGMRVIAEGIETEEQLERVKMLGADDMQGYLVSKPLAAADFERFLRSYSELRLAA
jgi:diguanylate cyclase (GGDEF)-like protein